MRDAPVSARARFEWPVRVYHEDTDSLGVVYHAGYLRFMERARTEWLRACGVEQSALAREHGAAFVVSRMEIEFLAPARYDDLLAVDVELARRRGASLDLAQAVRRGAALLCRATVRVACVDAATLRPRPIPKPLIPELGR